MTLIKSPSIPADIKSLKIMYKRFLEEFRDKFGQAKYRKAIDEMIASGGRSLVIDYHDLFGYPPTRELARDLLFNPEKHIEAASQAIKEIVLTLIGDLDSPEAAFVKYAFHARFENLPETSSIRELPSKVLNRFVQIKGIVIRVSEVFARISKAAYRCRRCNELYLVDVLKGEQETPKVCQSCGGKLLFDEESSEYINWQHIRIQELPEDLPPGSMPKHIEAELWDDLVDKVKPGDQVIVTGVIKLQPAAGTRKVARRPVLIYKRYLDINSVKIPSRTYERVDISPEDEKIILKLAKDPELEEKILNSIAPAIYGWRHIKKAIALALFGGNPIVLPDGTKIRGELHLLLVGDPGVAKCISGDALIFADGNLRRMDELADEVLKKGNRRLEDGYAAECSFEVLSMTKEMKVREKRCAGIAKRRATGHLLEIKTEGGLSIKVTPTHPFLIVDRNGRLRYVRADELRMGSYVATLGSFEPSKKRDLPKCSLKLDEDLMEVLGFLLGKGQFRIRKSTVLVTVEGEKRCVERFSKLVKECLKARGFRTYESSYKNEKLGFFIRKGVFEELISLIPSLNGKKISRKLPSWLLYSSREMMIPFIRGYMSSSASFSSKQRKLWFYTYNKTLTHQIRLILLRLGIVPEMRVNRTCKLIIKGDTLKFLKQIVGEDFPVLEGFDASKFLNRSSAHAFGIPHVGRLVREIREALKMPRSSLASSTGIKHYLLRRYELGLSKMPRDHLEALLKALKGELKRRSSALKKAEISSIRQNIELLESISKSRICWERVVEIRRVEGQDEWVYDVEVPGTNNFVANGFIVHNSQFLKYAAEVSPRGLYTTGKGSTAAGLTAAVIREPATGGWTLEAGALVIADGGVACLHPDSRVLINGRYVRIEDLFDPSKSYKARTKGEVVEIQDIDVDVFSISLKDMKLRRAKASVLRRKHWKGILLNIELKSGNKIMVTPDHWLLNGNSLEWKEARKFKIGDKLVASLKLPNSDEEARIQDKALEEEGLEAEIMERSRTLKRFNKKHGLSRDIFLDEIVRIEEIPYDGYVYDLFVPKLHNFVAEGVLVHNCIDEFDKMNEADRRAIHEAMEQQSYHPFTEIMFADGSKRKIGEFVEELMKKHRKRVINGVNCQILPLEAPYEMLTVDFPTLEVRKAWIDRVSRHVAPSYFVRLKFSNGREVIVTPEHPVFVYDGLDIITKPAIEIEGGDLTLGVRRVLEGRISADGGLPRFRVELLGPISSKKSENQEKVKIAPMRVERVEIIPNKGQYATPWVYDVTVEPTHNFISNGAVLHNTVSIAKAGIVATLNARTTIIAAANPKRGRYDADLSVAENINLPPTVLSRFDLIFVIRDVPDPDLDEKIADHILTLRVGAGKEAEPPIPPDLLEKYIAYARKKIRPVMTEKAAELIKQFYLEMRRMSIKKEQEMAFETVAITPRQLEALIRLSEARAKMFLRREVTEEDAKEAIELMKIMLSTVGYDVVAGRYDIYGVMTGKYISEAERRARELEILKEMEEDRKGPVPRVEFVQEVSRLLGIKDDIVEKDLRVLREEGHIYEPRPGFISRVR